MRVSAISAGSWKARAASWAVHDMAAVRACMHRDAVYRHYLPRARGPSPASCAASRTSPSRCRTSCSDFDVIRYRPLKIAFDDEGSGCRVSHSSMGTSSPAIPSTVPRASRRSSRATRFCLSRSSTMRRGCAPFSRW